MCTFTGVRAISSACAIPPPWRRKMVGCERMRAGVTTGLTEARTRDGGARARSVSRE